MFRGKIQILKFVTKYMPHLNIYALKLEKTIVLFEIITLKFVEMQSFVQNKNLLNLRPKIFRLKIEKPLS